MQTTLLSQGTDLMLFGMGTVFVFLVVLVFATQLMSKVVLRFAAKPVLTNKPQAIDPRIVKAIQAALDQHRGRRS